MAGIVPLWADVANPNPVKMRQPDGSTVTLRLHGDEFLSWYTSEDGSTRYQQGSDGWWRPAGKVNIRRSDIQAANELRAKRDQMFRKRGQSGLGLGWGSNHFLVILVEWSDQKFQTGSADYFRRALGQTGFSDNGSVGSAKDYYTDASSGRFTPNFDVYGPITLERRHNEYPANDESHHYYMAATMVQEAVSKLDATVDLSQYDCDGDGYIDNVYMLYPGFAQSNGGGTDTIWPHAWDAWDGVNHDGVLLSSYACSSELNGNTGTTLNGIGTFCHEFGHVIGMPDLYDTDYGTNGQALYPVSWNLMASGGHNSNGRIPARLSTYERYILGYITEFEDLAYTYGNKTIQSLDANKGYMIPTGNDGEFFIAEVRNGEKWDSPLPPGMLIYHVDRSENNVHGISASRRWDDWNLINGYADHPCYYICVPDPEMVIYQYPILGQYFESFSGFWVFPRTSDSLVAFWESSYEVTSYSPEAWDGSKAYTLTDISYSNGTASFYLSAGQRAVSGKVTDAEDGDSIEGAYVIVTRQNEPDNAQGRTLSLSNARRSALYETRTDSEGLYRIILDDGAPQTLDIHVYATGYLPSVETASGGVITKHFALQPVIAGSMPTTISKANLPLSSYGYWGYSERQNYTVAQKFTAAELASHIGEKIDAINFYTNATEEEIWVFVDFGTSERVLAKRVYDVNNRMSSDIAASNSIDVSDENITIPENTDVYVGYMIKNSNTSYSAFTDGGPYKSGGFMLQYDFSTTQAGGNNWMEPPVTLGWGAGNALVSMTLKPEEQIDPRATLSDMGISYISIPEGTLTAGSTLQLRLVTSKSRRPTNVYWNYDRAASEESSVVLASGKHVIQAILYYEDGTWDTVEARINVQ